MKQTSTRLLSLATAALIVAADQLAKVCALRLLDAEGASRRLLGPLDATLVFNRSNAFGVVPIIGDVSRWGLAAFNLAVAVGLSVWLFRRPRQALTSWGIGFLIGGAVGNAIDRIKLGVVVDFLDLSRLGFHWVFNVADACVDVGVALLLIATLSRPPEKQQATEQGSV